MIECIFTNGELRALDDLLPERKKAKRKLGYKMSQKQQEVEESDEDDLIEMNGKGNSLVRRKRVKKNYGDTQHISIDTELEELMSFEPKPVKRRSIPKIMTMNVSKQMKPPAFPDKVTLKGGGIFF